jgi:hypothetical protein
MELNFLILNFLRNIGWDGICIEPNPIIFEQLQSVRNCKCVKKAIS